MPIMGTCKEIKKGEYGTSYMIQEFSENRSRARFIDEYVLLHGIQNNKILIDNLRINKEHKLELYDPYSEPIKDKYKLSNKDNILENKVKLLGGKIHTLNTYCGHTCKLFKVANTYILFIPDDVRELNDSTQILDDGLYFTKEFKKCIGDTGNLEVIGGNGLVSIHSMLYGCKFNAVNFDRFNTHNVKDMEYVFCECSFKSINFSDLDTSRVISMDSMFMLCTVENPIDFSHFNTESVINMERMFDSAELKNLDISSFNTSKVRSMKGMFMECTTDKLDLTSFDTSSIIDASEMFKSSLIHEIDASSFKFSNDARIFHIFTGCNANIKCNFDTSRSNRRH